MDWFWFVMFLLMVVCHRSAARRARITQDYRTAEEYELQAYREAMIHPGEPSNDLGLLIPEELNKDNLAQVADGTIRVVDRNA